jgi:hypothetical protein
MQASEELENRKWEIEIGKSKIGIGNSRMQIRK